MSTYILMTKLKTEVLQDAKEREKEGKKWKDKIAEACPEVKWISHYALLGAYDFMDIFEAPDEEIAAKVSMITRAYGAVEAETWTAIPYKHYLELMGNL